MNCRKALSLFFPILIFLQLTPTQAATVETMYQNCKPFAENGFKVVPKNPASSVSCYAYFTAARDIANKNCWVIKNREPNQPQIHPLYEKLWAGKVPSTNVYIQEYLNEAEKNPQVWDNPASVILDSILVKYDC